MQVLKGKVTDKVSDRGWYKRWSEADVQRKSDNYDA